MTSPPNPLIDCHAHIYTQDMPLAGDAWHRPQESASIEDYTATLANHGVRFGVLAAASLYGDYNDYSIAACRQHPNIRTTVIVAPTISRAALEAMKADGVVGIRLQMMNRKNRPDLRSAAYRRLLDHIGELDWHVELHDYALMYPDVLDAIEPTGVKLVVDHFGRPTGRDKDDIRAAARIADAIARERTWIKISASFRIKPVGLADDAMTDLMRQAGPTRLLWGSDWPFAGFEGVETYDAALAAFHHLVPDPAVRRVIDQTGLDFYFGDRPDLLGSVAP